MSSRLRRGGALAAAVTLTLVLAVPVLAHEHREILDGRYEITIGFLNEPAFVGEQNGLFLQVVDLTADDGEAAAGEDEAAEEGDHGAGEPVIGLDQTLQAEVIFGDQTMVLELSPMGGELGSYQSVFFPTAVGDYTFRLIGELDGNTIDESFTSAPDGFDSVQAVEALQFPQP
ncbi:MAG: hypothetical protein H0V24_03330 [Chloroflexia bacterium]|nr:hypothetical protein [Chloroflexia bacterium]MDQ3411588.1 hypothetical protein [Chloroflexota bacterium]